MPGWSPSVCRSCCTTCKVVQGGRAYLVLVAVILLDALLLYRFFAVHENLGADRTAGGHDRLRRRRGSAARIDASPVDLPRVS